MSSELERAARDAVKTWRPSDEMDANPQLARDHAVAIDWLIAVLPPLPPTREELVARVLETVPEYLEALSPDDWDWAPDTPVVRLRAACRALVAYDEEHGT